MQASVNGEPVEIPPDWARMAFILQAAPLAWVMGLTFDAPDVDPAFASCLEHIRTELASVHQYADWAGRVEPSGTQALSSIESRDLLLYSGGVDSAFSLLAHPNTSLGLVAVRGADVNVDNEAGWATVADLVQRAADDYGRDVVVVSSNFRRMIKQSRVVQRYPQIGYWWPKVQHGLGLLGVTAPLVGPHGNAVISATYSSHYSLPWGSMPQVDERIRWADARVEHFGFDHSRQMKLDAIVAAAPQGFPVRVCYQDAHGPARNCGVCEKCLRTSCGLIAAGADPRRYGLDAARSEVADRARQLWKGMAKRPGDNIVFWWTEIQRAVAARSQGDDPVAQWLRQMDFAAAALQLGQRAERTKRRLQRAEAARARTSAALAPARKLGTRVKRRARRWFH